MKMTEKMEDETSPQVKKMNNIPPIIFMVVGFCLHTAMADCPSLCECKWKNGKETVICHDANLSHVPLHLDSGTQVLDLTGNNIQTLKHEEFSSAGLLNLQRIFISKCRLKSLQRYVFKNLKNLVELDLSMNSLNSIPSHTFDSIPELRELRLNENPIQTIMNEAFINLPQLVRLEMNNCRLTDIEQKAFVGLEKSLEWLKIDYNNLVNIHSSSLIRLENLHGLELAGNPWNCSCALRPLRKWILTKNIPFGIPPTCQYPQRLKNKSWDKLDLDEFACIPEISPSNTITHGVEGKNVTITCRIAGNPEPNVRWILRNKVIANLTGPPYSNGKKSYVVRLQNDSSDLTIFSADLQDAGVYVCSAENKAGKVEASVTLAVSRKLHEHNMSGRVLLVSILIGILLVIASCLLVLFVLTRRKSVVKWRTRECNNREENYEKIELNHKIADNSNGGVVQRSEISLVNNKKNGDYSVVPVNDIEQDIDDDEASTLDIASKSSQWSRNNEDDQDKWRKMDSVDPDRIISETRDDFPRITTSKSGTFKKITEPSVPTPTTTNFAKIPRESPDGFGIFVNPAYNTGFAGTSSQESSKKFPDIVGSKQSKFPGATTGSNSEGGSVNDLSDLFCTLPRKTTRIYRSTDSEAPLLLTDSRYISSGGESYSSQESNYLRKLEDPSYKYSTTTTKNNLNKNRVNQTSNSYLNLCRVDRPSTSATPLLNISNLENRQTRTEIFSPTLTTPNANTYDYHATQLERFLEEYKNLQKQLTKMKETCDNLTNLKPALSRTNSSHDMMENSKMKSCSPNFNNSIENSIEFRNFQSELTKYLLTKSSSPKPYASGSMFNN